MSIEDIIKNQDILDCWKEIQKSNSDKNISKGIFEYDIEEYHTFLLDENVSLLSVSLNSLFSIS